MSEVMSFGNIVSSLRAVRNDYHEHLKSVPQYEAFLLVESSTQKVADTLQGVINSAAPSMASDVVAALELAKANFREHLASVPEYRALLAIDKLISDVAADLGRQADPSAATEVEPAAPAHETNAALAGAAEQTPADETAAAIAGIAEAVTAQLDETEPPSMHAADAPSDPEQETLGHQDAVQPPAIEFVSSAQEDASAEVVGQAERAA